MNTKLQILLDATQSFALRAVDRKLSIYDENETSFNVTGIGKVTIDVEDETFSFTPTIDEVGPKLYSKIVDATFKPITTSEADVLITVIIAIALLSFSNELLED